MPTNIRKPGSSDFTASGYWSAGSSPATGEDLKVTSGKDSFTSNTNLSAVDAQSLTFGPDHGDDATVIGTASAPLRIDLDRTGASDGLYMSNRFREANLAGGTGGVWTKAVIAPINPSARVNLGAVAITTLIIENGIVDVTSDCTCTTIRVYGGDVTIRVHGSNVPTIENYGGRVRLFRDWTALTCTGGDTEWDVAPETGTAYTGGTVTLTGSGARVAPVSGSCGTCVFRAGTVDKSKARKELTLGSGGSTLYGPGCTEVLPRKGITVTDNSRSEEGTGPRKVAA